MSLTRTEHLMPSTSKTGEEAFLWIWTMNNGPVTAHWSFHSTLIVLGRESLMAWGIFFLDGCGLRSPFPLCHRDYFRAVAGSRRASGAQQCLWLVGCLIVGISIWKFTWWLYKQHSPIFVLSVMKVVLWHSCLIFCLGRCYLLCLLTCQQHRYLYQNI